MPLDCAMGGLLDGLLLTGAPHRIAGCNGRYGVAVIDHQVSPMARDLVSALSGD